VKVCNAAPTGQGTAFACPVFPNHNHLIRNKNQNIMMRSITRLLILFVLLFYAGTNLLAQGTQAIIAGSVSEDKSQTVIGATVTVKNESTGFQTSTITNEKGEYTIKQLPLGGPYTVTVSYMGFGEQRKTGYTLNQGDLLRLNFAMQSSATEIKAVEVVANSMKNNIKTIGSATSVTAKDISKLPVNGRNFTSLIDLSPLSSGINLSGQLASSTNFTIDGMTAKGTVAAGTTAGAYSISMEAVREFKVVTNQYDVTYGRSGGGTISTVTKSGTNTLSGSAFTFARTNWLSSQYDLRGTTSGVMKGTKSILLINMVFRWQALSLKTAHISSSHGITRLTPVRCISPTYRPHLTKPTIR
jgi:hypothetical protein